MRLVRLVEEPESSNMLVPLVVKEITYRLLAGGQSPQRHVACPALANPADGTSRGRLMDKRPTNMELAGPAGTIHVSTLLSPTQRQIVGDIPSRIEIRRSYVVS